MFLPFFSLSIQVRQQSLAGTTLLHRHPRPACLQLWFSHSPNRHSRQGHKVKGRTRTRDSRHRTRPSSTLVYHLAMDTQVRRQNCFVLSCIHLTCTELNTFWFIFYIKGLPYYAGMPGVPSAFQYGPTVFVPPASAKQPAMGLANPSSQYHQQHQPSYGQHAYGTGMASFILACLFNYYSTFSPSVNNNN